MRGYFVYILTNYLKSVLYVGVTSNLYGRVAEHRDNFKSNFASKYKCRNLVYFEIHESIEYAIQREKRVKRWRRKWKEQLINDFNPNWRDLTDEVRDY